MIADMHTHSEHSHDCSGKMERMCLSQIEKGVSFFAVTDHIDIYSHKDYDIFTPIVKAREEVLLLNEKYGDKITVLSGMEIGEGFYYPEVAKKAEMLCPHDVIIGSVHCIKYKSPLIAYSKVDFSLFTEDELYEYLGIYCDDVISMLKIQDFDILAHITCPIRYITGKYKREIDLSFFDEKIDEILRLTIEKGISMEVNTSSFDALSDFMPTREIIKKYYDFGGRMVTLGSDAHIAENAACHFEEAIAFLKETGFTKLYYYVKRKPIAYEI